MAGEGHPERKGVTLEPLKVEEGEDGSLTYEHVSLTFGPVNRTATITLRGPSEVAPLPDDPATLGCGWCPLALFRQLDDALLRLRFNAPEVGLILLETEGDPAKVLEMDAQLEARKDHWFVNEVRHKIKRVLKRLDVTARSFFALMRPTSCYAGTLLEVALAADRTYMLDEDGSCLALSPLNGGAYPMGNGLTRLQTRFLAEPGRPAELLEGAPRTLTGEEADEAGLLTTLADEFDWEDDIRLAIEERASLSPDSLTGLEANLRFAGPETLETKIFGRLSAWQNWIFQRPNAVGPRGALTLYGQPESAEFNWDRT